MNRLDSDPTQRKSIVVDFGDGHRVPVRCEHLPIPHVLTDDARMGVRYVACVTKLRGMAFIQLYMPLWRILSKAEKDAVLMHEGIHIALGHPFVSKKDMPDAERERQADEHMPQWAKTSLASAVRKLHRLNRARHMHRRFVDCIKIARAKNGRYQWRLEGWNYRDRPLQGVGRTPEQAFKAAIHALKVVTGEEEGKFRKHDGAYSV